MRDYKSIVVLIDSTSTTSSQDYQTMISFRTQYQLAVGLLIYAILGFWPELAFSVSVVS